MKLERDTEGDFIIESAEVAARFAFPVSRLRRLMNMGLITSMVEVGQGEDEGTSRLTLHCGNRIWRAILDAHDNVASEEIRVVGRSRAAKPF